MGHRQATYDTAAIYYNGDGVEKDNEVALKYFKLAAEMGIPQAKGYVEKLEAAMSPAE